MTTYVDLQTFKDALLIPSTDSTRDELLSSALDSASRYIDRVTGRRFYIDESPVPRVVNPRGNVVCDRDGNHLLIADIGDDADFQVEVGQGLSFTDVTAAVELEPTDALDQGEPITSLLRLGGRWSSSPGQRVRITAHWGWPEVPAEIVSATLIQATRIFKRKDSPEGVTGSAEWGVVRVSRTDPDVMALTQKFMKYGMA